MSAAIGTFAKKQRFTLLLLLIVNYTARMVVAGELISVSSVGDRLVIQSTHSESTPTTIAPHAGADTVTREALYRAGARGL